MLKHRKLAYGTINLSAYHAAALHTCACLIVLFWAGCVRMEQFHLR